MYALENSIQVATRFIAYIIKVRDMLCRNVYWTRFRGSWYGLESRFINVLESF